MHNVFVELTLSSVCECKPIQDSREYNAFNTQHMHKEKHLRERGKLCSLNNQLIHDSRSNPIPHFAGKSPMENRKTETAVVT
ncbi:hypothetical protein Trydic_g14495 [Trypoxylus dichotomus]